LKSEQTQERIVRAALEAFATHGFDGASTRQIAALAGENQGLITYHFSTKEKLWQAAVDSIFSEFRRELEERMAVLMDADTRTQLRLLLIFFVRYAARRPEQMRLMVQEGKADSARMRWLVDRHVRDPFGIFGSIIGKAIEEGIVPEASIVHYFYMLVGASSLLFAVAPECKHLTGADPFDPTVVEAHAEAVVNLVLR
jgi:AcrR family transcriptional regulator